MIDQIEFPDTVVSRVLELIQQDDVRSMSCPFNEPTVWRALVAEQRRRAERTGKPPQKAFTLWGPDADFYTGRSPVEAYGGTIHIPFERMFGGDLVLLPTWRNWFGERAEKTGWLSTAIRCCCYYILTPRDFGEVGFATRTKLCDWIEYKSKLPYVPCAPLGETKSC